MVVSDEVLPLFAMLGEQREVKGIDRSWLRVEETLHSKIHQDTIIRVIFPRFQSFPAQVRKCSGNTNGPYYHI